MRSELFRVYRRIRPEELGLESDPIGEADVDLKDPGRRVRLMFGVYSEQGLRSAFARYGSFKRLEEKGVGPVDVKLVLDDPFRPNVQLWSKSFDEPIIDVVLSQTTGKAMKFPSQFHDAKLLYLESVLLQHPGRCFEWGRPPLPEQRHPGLSLSSEVLDLLILVARRISADGMVLIPSTFHAARIYERHFQFVDGRAEGVFRALRHAGELRPLWLLSWAIELGCVKEGRRILRWNPSVMLAPLHEELARMFELKSYLDQVAANEWRRLDIDWELLRARFPWNLMPQSRPPAVISALLKPKAM